MSKSEQARQLFEEKGLSKAEIAKQLGIHYSVVHSALKNVGIVSSKNEPAETIKWVLREKKMTKLTKDQLLKLPAREHFCERMKDIELSSLLNIPQNAEISFKDNTFKIIVLRNKLFEGRFETNCEITDEEWRKTAWEAFEALPEIEYKKNLQIVKIECLN